MQSQLPSWEPAARSMLARAMEQNRLLGWLTPTNLARELEALCADWRRGNERLPRWRYPAAPASAALCRRLGELADELEPREPLGPWYAGRARELALELELGTTADPQRFVELGRRRFTRRDGFDDQADGLSDRWLAASRPEPRRATIRSDDGTDPRSLLCCMRAEVERQELPIQVTPTQELSALAAIGPGAIYVIAGRRLSEADVSRTVLHEIHGHALPQLRGQRARLGIFQVGTAHGADDQEGRAIGLEEEAQLLDGGRRLELALRHAAARAVEAGASFVETARVLGEHPVSLFDRLRITARAHRGGGLGRERVYLPAYLRVRAARAADPAVDEVLASGSVAVGAVAALRRWRGDHLSGHGRPR
ncbi:MAG: DUF1704 domain-containing protein [Deltaproteobacteria bacterium]|jgi:hypothetical protein|nr:DUF1704 domain-containing protein [Deltaproteobacteria bacterium]MBW2536175.1 DUF1704 domain-containing protein [Deltaproteobacteria bacterium]